MRTFWGGRKAKGRREGGGGGGQKAFYFARLIVPCFMLPCSIPVGGKIKKKIKGGPFARLSLK